MTIDFLQKTQATGSPEYFEAAEKDAKERYEELIKPFIPSLNGLNCLEIACGHGRIASQVLKNNEPNHLQLIDINPDNIKFVLNRFKGRDEVHAEVNNGIDLRNLEDQHYNFVYSFDSMVHFNRELIELYINEIKRVLTPGGQAYIHYSNWGKTCTTENHGPGLRGDMNRSAMLELVKDCRVIHDKVIDWGVKGLDAIIVFEV